MIGRALRLRCPLCGSRGIWRAYGQLVDHCPTCAYKFEREDGYWVGAMIVNIAAAMLTFFVVLVGSFIAFGGSPPGWLLWLSLAAMVIVPIAVYPWSKTLWMCVDLMIHPYTPEERPTRH